MAKIVLAMSGGVDSSVCAHLLKQEGHEVVGVFMQHGISVPGAEKECPKSTSSSNEHSPNEHSPDELPQFPQEPIRRKHGCCSEEDAADAQKVADRYGIPLHVMNFRDEFQQIVDYFVEEYSSCRTPNPCIVCNALLKFGKIFDFADSIGADFVATGHYARVERVQPFALAECANLAERALQLNESGSGEGKDRVNPAVALGKDGEEYRILRGIDLSKDQSYVLHRIPREKLRRLIFPLGNYQKDEIRRLAEEAGLHVAKKRDSQEICFVPDGDHSRFVKDFIFRKTGTYPDTAGDFVTSDGKNLGPHEGLERYTIGQRKGLRLAFKEPHFVLRLEPDSHRVILGLHDELAQTELTVSNAVWQIPDPPAPFECEVKIRYRSPSVPALVIPLTSKRFRIQLKEPVYGIAPGQAAVCYRGEEMLGGGWIDSPAN